MVTHFCRLYDADAPLFRIMLIRTLSPGASGEADAILPVKDRPR
jgi:hypothetical protein